MSSNSLSSGNAGSVNDTWRVGVLFSRSGVLSVSETEHFLGTALAIEQINASGGIAGRLIEPVPSTRSPTPRNTAASPITCFWTKASA